MSLRVNSNVTALATHGNMVINDAKLSSSIEKLSSGLRITCAADDAAGLTISEKLKTQIRGISRAQMNVQDGESLLQTAEGALNETHSMLQRMRELAIQSGNDTLTTTDRLEIQKEIAQLKEDIDRIANDTEYNTRKLLDGTGTATISTSDPSNLTGVVSGDVVTFSDFSVTVMIKQEVIPGIGYKSYDGQAEIQRSAIFTTLDGGIASSSTTLASISNFYDAHGNFILDLPQTLYLQGDNSQGNCVVSKELTLSQLSERIQSMATADQLDKGLHFEGSTAVLETSGEFSGQITVTSGKPGALGRINFTGSEELVKALGFEDVVKPEDPIYSVAVTNIGVEYSERKTLFSQVSGNRATGLIEGVDLVYEPPQSANISSQEAYKGVTVKNDITFDLDDSTTAAYGGLATPKTISVPKGDYTMDQVAEMINGQLVEAYGSMDKTLVHCKVNTNNELEFSTIGTGSASWVKISGTNPAGMNELSIADGTYRGSGGTGATYIADAANNGIITKWDYTAAADNVKFNLSDMHGNDKDIVLNKNYTGIGVQSIADDINAQISTSLNIRAEVVNGVLAFRSTETGYNSGFQIKDNGNLNFLQMAAGDVFNGTDGNVASQNFVAKQSAVDYGFTVAGTNPDDNLVFTVADLDGTAMTITINAETAGYEIDNDPTSPDYGKVKAAPVSGGSFVSASDIVRDINKQAVASGCKIHAEFDENTKKIKFISNVTGKDGKIVLTDISDPASKNNLGTVLGLEDAVHQNGIGQTAYKMHLKDTSITLQIGPNEGETCKTNILDCSVKALGIQDLDLTTAESANRGIGLIDNALQIVSSERARIGAIQNRLEYTSSSLAVAGENMTNAQSRIADVDMASEMIKMTSAQIMQQAGTAMLAQANSSAQNVLSLLK